MRLRKDAKVELLGKIPLLSHYSKRELGRVAAIADEIDLPEGKVLTREGERGRELVILLEGTAEVRKGGRKINTLGPSDFLGEIALISRLPRTATVTTTSPVRALVVNDRDFRSVLTRSLETQLKLLDALAERLGVSL